MNSTGPDLSIMERLPALPADPAELIPPEKYWEVQQLLIDVLETRATAISGNYLHMQAQTDIDEALIKAHLIRMDLHNSRITVAMQREMQELQRSGLVLPGGARVAR